MRQPSLDEVWMAAAERARESLLAVGRGEQQASRRQVEDWELTLARAEQWGLAP